MNFKKCNESVKFIKQKLKRRFNLKHVFAHKLQNFNIINKFNNNNNNNVLDNKVLIINKAHNKYFNNKQEQTKNYFKKSTQNIVYFNNSYFSTFTNKQSINNNNSNKEDKEDKNKKPKKIKALNKDIYKYITPYFNTTKKLLVSSVIVTLVSKALIAVSPYMLKLTVDYIIAKKPVSLVVSLLCLYAGAKILGTTILEFRIVIINKISNQVLIKFTQDMIKYLFKVDYRMFKNNSQDLINSFNKSSQGIESLNRFIISNAMANSIEFLMVSVCLYYFIGIKYCAITMITYILYILATNRIIKYRMPLLNERFKLEMKNENKISEIIYNIDTIKYFQQEKKENKNVFNYLLASRKQEDKVVSSLAFMNSVQSLIIVGGMTVGLVCGVLDCYSGLASPGDLIMLQAMFSQIMQPLFFLGTILRTISETKVRLNFAIKTIKEKEKIDNEKASTNELKEYINKGCEVKFENVYFEYNNNNKDNTVKQNEHNYVLNNLNLEFKKNSFNAIIGRSGQGKSTIFNLIYKLLEPTSGRILIDGQDIKYLKEESFRKYITICPQNGSLFNDTILYNISYPISDHTSVSYYNNNNNNKKTSINSNVFYDSSKLLIKNEVPLDIKNNVEKLTKDFNLYDKIISFEDGFNSNVGTLGSKLSGGEKQRVLLARALINKDADLIILDEPTSNLDSYNEMLVMNYLLELKKTKTVIICSHRLNTLALCDNIHVLDNGKIIEQGSHQELINDKKSVYYSLSFNNIDNALDNNNNNNLKPVKTDKT